PPTLRANNPRFGCHRIPPSRRAPRAAYLRPSQDALSSTIRSKEHNYYYQQPRYARDAPQVLEEGQARAGEGRKGRVQSRKGSEGREAREPGSEGRAPPTGDEEAGREEARGRGADPAAPPGRSGSGERGSPCRPRRSGPHRPSDEERLREERGPLPARRAG